MIQPFDPNGRVFLITGGNSGIGFAAAQELAAKGAKVVLVCRDAQRAETACENLARAGARQAPEYVVLDLASLASIRAGSDVICSRFPRVDVLINNAGLMALPRTVTEDGFEAQIGVNHLGHFALTGLLLRVLRESPAPRVVTVSSLAHWFGRVRFNDLQGERSYGKWTAYNQSKLANLLFSFELQRRCAATMPELSSVACHPGYAATNLQLVGPQLERSPWLTSFFRVANRFVARSPAYGAQPTIQAATGMVTGGTLIGPEYGSWGGIRTQRSSPASRSTKLARQLWDLSVSLTGVDPGL